MLVLRDFGPRLALLHLLLSGGRGIGLLPSGITNGSSCCYTQKNVGFRTKTTIWWSVIIINESRTDTEKVDRKNKPIINNDLLLRTSTCSINNETVQSPTHALLIMRPCKANENERLSVTFVRR